MKHVLLIILCLGLASCAPRPRLVVVPESEVEAQAEIKFWVANFRRTDGLDEAFGLERPEALRYERHVVAVPPRYRAGIARLPLSAPDPARDFVSRSITPLPSAQDFAADLHDSMDEGEEEVLLYVHGYNTNHAEAVYGFAQILHVYDVPVPSVLFSWPSAAQARGYVYDRDSVAISRNRLESVIRQLARDNRQIILAGHSMGTYLIMETLRQMELRQPGLVNRLVDGVILNSPDIDPEVFRDQLAEIEPVPSPFIVATSRKDRALKISGLLTGRDVRLGSLTDPAETRDLPLTLIDLTEFADGSALNHSTFATSPTAVTLLRGIIEQGPLGDADLGATVRLGLGLGR